MAEDMKYWETGPGPGPHQILKLRGERYPDGNVVFVIIKTSNGHIEITDGMDADVNLTTEQAIDALEEAIQWLKT